MVTLFQGEHPLSEKLNLIGNGQSMVAIMEFQSHLVFEESS